MAFGAWTSEVSGTRPAAWLFTNIVNDIVYFIDGSYNFWSYNVVTRTYTQLTSYPSGAGSYTLVRRGTKVYGDTGYQGGGVFYRLAFYDISTDQWTQSSIATAGGKTYAVTTFVFADDDTIWVWGRTSTQVRCLKYTISTDTWTAYANSTTIENVQYFRNVAIKADGSVVYGAKRDASVAGLYCTYTIATDTYTEVADIGRDFGFCVDDDKLWYNARTTPWAKGYLDTADDSLNDTIIAGNDSEFYHGYFAVDDALTMALNWSRYTASPPSTTRGLDSNGISFGGIPGTLALVTSLFAPTITIVSAFIPKIFII